MRRPALYRMVPLLLAGACTAWLVPAATDLDRLQQLAHSRYGSDVAQQVADWRAMLGRARLSAEGDKLLQVNLHFNQRIRWVEDRELWQEEDYWATLLETLGKGAGDCEDFAIAKYVSLLLAGVPEAKLRLTYVRMRQLAQTEPIAHMVLAYYPSPEAEPMILDNLDEAVRVASQRSDLTPVYSFNAKQLWLRGAQASESDPTARISRWRDVLRRLQAEHTL